MLEDIRKERLNTPVLFSWELDPQGMAKLISEVMTLPMWCGRRACPWRSLGLTSLLPARETIDQGADYA